MKYSDNRNAYIYFRRALSLGLYVRAKKSEAFGLRFLIVYKVN